MIFVSFLRNRKNISGNIWRRLFRFSLFMSSCINISNRYIHIFHTIFFFSFAYFQRYIEIVMRCINQSWHRFSHFDTIVAAILLLMMLIMIWPRVYLRKLNGRLNLNTSKYYSSLFDYKSSFWIIIFSSEIFMRIITNVWFSDDMQNVRSIDRHQVQKGKRMEKKKKEINNKLCMQCKWFI